ncbi:uncharacterized [Tachysurus ichikawai]
MYSAFSTAVVPEYDRAGWSHCGAGIFSFITLRGRSLGLVGAERAEERLGREEQSREELEPCWGKEIRDRQRVPCNSGSYERVFTERLHAMRIFLLPPKRLVLDQASSFVAI